VLSFNIADFWAPPALRQSLHPAFGAKPSVGGRPLEPIRVFIVGARAESSLPPHIWQQLSHLFQDNVAFHIYFIGPEVSFPHKTQGVPVNNIKEQPRFGVPASTTYISEQLSLTTIQARYDEVHDALGSFDPYR
jgi:splicing suppressor protein 51